MLEQQPEHQKLLRISSVSEHERADTKGHCVEDTGSDIGPALQEFGLGTGGWVRQRKSNKRNTTLRTSSVSEAERADRKSILYVEDTGSDIGPGSGAGVRHRKTS